MAEPTGPNGTRAHAKGRNPYGDLPNSSSWKQGVANVSPCCFDPANGCDIQIGQADPIATAGSCFAQHLATGIQAAGFFHLVTEYPPDGAPNPLRFSARYGNIYTVLQLRQLIERAYGLFEPQDSSWVRPDGRWVDAFRPREFPEGFASPDLVLEERSRHLVAVRAMFEKCKVFVFTLGLTESWVSEEDRAAVPIAPHVVAAPAPAHGYKFKNLTFDEMRDDLSAFLSLLREVNPSACVILTVSPVPLAATCEPRHVALSNTLSKSALRVTADWACRTYDNVAYFPSYEIITAYPGQNYFGPDLRSVSPNGVEQVMHLFRKHCLVGTAQPKTVEPSGGSPNYRPAAHNLRVSSHEFRDAICDEELLDR